MCELYYTILAPSGIYSVMHVVYNAVSFHAPRLLHYNEVYEVRFSFMHTYIHACISSVYLFFQKIE